MNVRHNRDYNISSSEWKQRPDRFRLPVDIEEAYYWEGNEPESAAVGNVTVTTTAEWLFLRQPLGMNRPLYWLMSDSNVDWNHALPEVNLFAGSMG